eukprot:jgi/Chrzof1/5130/Cz15g12160.t1
MLKAVLIDLNGTLHVGEKEVPGSILALKKLCHTGLHIRFVTNTTKDTTANFVKLVSSIGFDIHPNEVFSSIRAAHSVLTSQRLRPVLLLHPNALPEFDGLDTSDPDAVVVGLAKEAFSYTNMNQAFRLLMDKPDAPLIAIHKGKYLKDTDGCLSLGPGPYVIALEYATGKTAQVVGKPEPSFFQLALDDVGVPASAAVMIGDDVRDDIGGAQRAGMTGVLVRTGKYLPGDEQQYDDITRDATVDDFAAAVEWIIQQPWQQPTIDGWCT